MITFEALDVILRVQNLSSFQARMRAGAASVRGVGRTARTEATATGAAVYAAAKKATLGLAGLAAAAAVVGFNQSVEFQKQMTMVHTQAGATKAEVAGLKDQVLDLAKTLPQGPVELAKGLYHIESIGIRGQKAMEALKVAAEGAAVGNADLEQTTTALGSAWLAGISGVSGFKNTMAVMNATVGAGNMRMDELVTALGTGVLPTAKLAGLGIQDVMGALALLKDEGYGAYGAMAQFATALHFFTSPTDKATKAFRKLGMSQLEIADIMRKQGMVAALTELRTRLDAFSSDKTQQEKLLGAILPGGRGRVFRVLLNQIDRYQMKLDQINKTTGKFDEAIKTTHETAAFRLHSAWSKLQVALVRLGDTIRETGAGAVIFAIGVLTDFINLLAGIPDDIKQIVDWWNGLPGPIKLVATAIGLVVAQFAIMYTAMKAITIITALWEGLRITILAVRGALILLMLGSGPIMLAAMLALSIVILLVAKHWKWVKQAAIDAWHWIKQAAIDFYHWMRDHTILGSFIAEWKALKKPVGDVLGWITHRVSGAVHRWANRFRDFTNFLERFKHKITHGGLLGLGGVHKFDFVAKLFAPTSNPIVPIGHRAIGGPVMSGMNYLINERGPEVFTPGTRGYISPLSNMKPTINVPHSTQEHGGEAYSSSTTEHIHTHVHLDGKQLTEVVTKRIANRKARR